MNNFGTGFAVGFLTAAVIGSYDALKRRKKIAQLQQQLHTIERELNLKGHNWKHGSVHHTAAKTN